jgi:hypothetical protein
MTAGTGDSRDGGEVEALITDRYLESLLVGDQLGRAGLGLVPAAFAPAGYATDDRLHPAVRLAATQLTRDLPRFHPSFRFEERLAQRLAGIADAMRLPAVAGAEGTLIRLDPVPGREDLLFDPLADGSLDDDRFLGTFLDGPLDERFDRVRPLLIGGALTSAALSLAGAFFVAWRRTRPPLTPMARAARAVARGRLA